MVVVGVVVVLVVAVVVVVGVAIVRTHEKQTWPWNGLRNEPSSSRYHHFRGHFKTNPFLTFPRARHRSKIAFKIDFWPMLDPKSSDYFPTRVYYNPMDKKVVVVVKDDAGGRGWCWWEKMMLVGEDDAGGPRWCCWLRKIMIVKKTRLLMIFENLVQLMSGHFGVVLPSLGG